MTVIALAVVASVAYYYWFFCPLPNLVRSVAVNPSGTRIAISYQDHTSFGFGNYGGLATAILTLDERGAVVEATSKRSANAGFVRDIDDDGRLIMSDSTGQSSCSVGLEGAVIDKWERATESKFSTEKPPRLVTWSRGGTLSGGEVSVFVPGNSSTKWQLPLELGCQVMAANCCEDPLKIAVLILQFDGATNRPGERRGVARVETWLSGQDAPVETWAVPGTMAETCGTAISPSGASVVIYENGDKRRRSLELWRKSQPDALTKVADAPDIWDPQEGEHIRFLSDSEAIMTDLSGRMAVLDVEATSLKYIDRPSKEINLMATDSKGSIVVIATRIWPTCEVWRRDANGLQPWLEIDMRSKMSVKRLFTPGEVSQLERSK